MLRYHRGTWHHDVVTEVKRNCIYTGMKWTVVFDKGNSDTCSLAQMLNWMGHARSAEDRGLLVEVDNPEECGHIMPFIQGIIGAPDSLRIGPLTVAVDLDAIPSASDQSAWSPIIQNVNEDTSTSLWAEPAPVPSYILNEDTSPLCELEATGPLTLASRAGFKRTPMATDKPSPPDNLPCLP